MANALSELALYAALSEQVYRRAYVDKHADQPLAVDGDGSPEEQVANAIPGQTLIDPKGLNHAGDQLTQGRFLFDNNYIYDVSNGFVAMVTQGADESYTVTFRGTDAGDASFWTLASATVFGVSTPVKLDQLDWNTNLLLGQGDGLDNSQAQDAINLTKAVIANANGASVTVIGQSLGGGLAGIVSSVLGICPMHSGSHILSGP